MEIAVNEKFALLVFFSQNQNRKLHIVLVRLVFTLSFLTPNLKQIKTSFDKKKLAMLEHSVI